jgi:hypothetical protein
MCAGSEDRVPVDAALPYRRMAWSTRAILAAVLVVAAIFKLLGGPAPQRDMRALHITPHVVTVIAVVEITIAVALLSFAHRFALSAVFLFCILSLSLAYLMVLRALDIDVRQCGCFGTRRVGLAGHVLILAGMLILSARELLRRPNDTAADAHTSPRTPSRQ